MESDGYTLDDKREPIDEKGNIPDIIKEFKKKRKSKNSFLVSYEKIKTNNYKLSPSVYKQHTEKEVEYRDPIEIITEISKTEKEIQKGLEDLKNMIAKR